MTEYSAFLITEAGTVAGVRSVHSDSDEEALKMVRRLLVEARFLRADVWDHRDHIGTVHLSKIVASH